MAIKYNKAEDKDEKTIGFKEALGMISFKNKEVSQKPLKKNKKSLIEKK